MAMTTSVSVKKTSSAAVTESKANTTASTHPLLHKNSEALGGAKKENKPPITELRGKDIKNYMDVIETVARVEASRLPSHLIDYSEIVNLGALALYTLFKNNPNREYNITYLSTAIKWAVRNELRNRYKWYALRQTEASSADEDMDMDDAHSDDPDHVSSHAKSQLREVVYETILSVDSMMDAENPHEVRDDAATPEEQSHLRELAALIRDVIDKLPERDRRVLEARFYQNLRMREIGAKFGISPSRTSRVVQSALDKVKAELERRNFVY